MAQFFVHAIKFLPGIILNDCRNYLFRPKKIIGKCCLRNGVQVS